ncbi:MAG: alpha-amylase family protein [Chloroflexota bacterium]|nr:alpha-amylase family protein [Chloroflexota bacterium]
MGLHDQWYENAIIYCLDVETYADSNGDGVGDFPGLTRRLDYLSGLGVTCLWLMPFYPSPGGDDGYDVSDYVSIDPRLGTIAEFAEFVFEARERGLHVIVDLVPNHTSIEHPWFQAARSDPESPYRDYYVWRTDDPGDTSAKVVFPGEQEGIWTWDDAAGAYYLHHFYAFQPDLNFSNPAVRDEFRTVIALWIQLGVDGFRVDAAPFLISLEGIDGKGAMDLAHEFLAEMSDFATSRKGSAILLGEVDEGLSTIADFFGGGNQLQALFNFPLNRLVFLGLAQESADAITYGLGQLPTIPEQGQWVNFLRHHDELNLSRLTKDQREQVFTAFGPEPEMQVYGRGLRRRLAPMLGGDPKWIRLAYSVLFSLPGAPMVYYGEEIGMGEQVDLPGRMSVRSPMQWMSHDHGGFSTAALEDLVRPMVSTGAHGYEEVSVGKMRADRGSLLNWMAGLMRTRRECSEIGTGAWSVMQTGNDAVLALRHDIADSAIVILNNLGRKRCTISLDLTPGEVSSITDLFSDRDYEPIDLDTPRVRMEGFGYRWMRIGGIY